MTNETKASLGTSVEDLEKVYGEGEKSAAFARTEFTSIRRVIEVAVKPMPEDIMTLRRIPHESAEFKAMFPQGYNSLYVLTEGIDVYQEPDNKIELWVPLFGTDAGKMGQPKGRNSQAHVTIAAFQAVYGVSPIGKANQEKLTGKVANWGQHLGGATIEGQQVEWGWDVPRTRLPDTFKYEGEVRHLKPRGGAAAAGGAVGTTELSGDDLKARLAEILTGYTPEQVADANTKVIEEAGLPDEWYAEARKPDGNVMAKAFQAGIIDVVEGKSAPKAQ